MSCEGNNNEVTFENFIISPSEKTDAPTVILFGWAGCRDRYLSKYSQIYKKNGFTTVRYIAPIEKVRLQRSFDSYREFAEEVHEKLHLATCKTDSVLFFHVFSMNGCGLFVAFWELLGKVKNGEDFKKKVTGVVYDSSPADVTPWKRAKAWAFATLPPSLGYSDYTRLAYQVILASSFGYQRSMVWLRSFWEQDAFENNYAYFKLKKMDDLPENQLFLYSLSDDICTHESIEEFQAVQKMKGKKVLSQCWADSLHVEHLRKYREDYSRLCLDFTETLLCHNSRRGSFISWFDCPSCEAKLDATKR